MKPAQMEKEKHVKAEVKKLLDTHNWFWWMPPANGFGRVGVSDFNAMRGGVFIAIETKFGKNSKPTALQVAFLNSIRAEDGFAFVVNERNLEWLKAWLEAFDRSVEAASWKKKPTDEDGAMMVNALKELTDYD
jgi:hypothetical protein